MLHFTKLHLIFIVIFAIDFIILITYIVSWHKILFTLSEKYYKSLSTL
jgi:hypothetical protein